MCSAKYLLCFRNAQATSGLTGRDETTAAPDGIQGPRPETLDGADRSAAAGNNLGTPAMRGAWNERPRLRV